MTGAIADEAVRRYYKQDFSARLRQMFAPQRFAAKDNAARRRNFGDKGFDGRPRRGSDADRFVVPILNRDEAYVAASAQLAASPLHRGHRAAIPLREALILQAAMNHPWLLHDHLEELAEAEFRHADTQKLKSALIDVFAHHFAEDFAQEAAKEAAKETENETGHAGQRERTALAAELGRRGFADLLVPHRARHHHAVGLGLPAASRP